jgi:hypothetical protein
MPRDRDMRATGGGASLDIAAFSDPVYIFNIKIIARVTGHQQGPL